MAAQEPFCFPLGHQYVHETNEPIRQVLLTDQQLEPWPSNGVYKVGTPSRSALTAYFSLDANIFGDGMSPGEVRT